MSIAQASRRDNPALWIESMVGPVAISLRVHQVMVFSSDCYIDSNARCSWRHILDAVQSWKPPGPIEQSHDAYLPSGGDGMKLVPPARPDDGLLDMVELGRIGRFEALFKLMPRLHDGGHLAHPSVSQRQGMRSIELESGDAETLVDVDGETIGRLPATVTVLPHAIRVPDFR